MQYFFYVGVGGFTGGILLRSFFDFGSIFPAFLIFLSVAIGFAAILSIYRKDVLLLGVFLLFAGLGIIRFEFSELPRTPELDARAGSEVHIEGLVVDEPDVRESRTLLSVKTETLDGKEVDTKILVSTDPFTNYAYGDQIEATGRLEIPTGFTTKTGRYFDYRGFLEKSGIAYTLSFSKTSILSSGGGNIIRRELFAFKSRFIESVNRSIPDPQSSLLGGLVVGAKQSLGEELLADFRTTGIIHVVVLSGYNVTIVAEAIMRALTFLPRYAGLATGAGAIVLFALLTGGSATIVRASIMALLVVLARATNRTYDITRALFLAGFLMLVHNPKILVFDPSFQLSFLATLGLLWLAPEIEKRFKLVPTKWKLREFAIATIATQIFVLPLLLYMTGEVSTVALFVNLLILAAVPLTMLFGFITGVIGFASTLLAIPFAFITFGLLAYQLKVVEIFSSFTFASVQIGEFPFWGTLLIYTLYGAALLWLWKRKEPATLLSRAL